MSSPNADPSSRSSIVAGVLLVLVAAMGFWWSARQEPDGATGPGASSLRAGGAERAARAGPQRRTLRRGAGPRQAVHLTGAEGTREPAGTVGPLQGRVVSSTTGSGVAQAQLSFAAGDELHGIAADDEGRFRFQPAKLGSFELAAVTAAGYLPFAPAFGHSPMVFTALRGRGIRGAVITLTPAIEYQGVVIDPTGEVVADAVVTRLGDDPSGQTLAQLPHEYRSDDQGRFVFHASDGTVFEARKEPFALGRAQLDFAAQVSHRLVIRLGEPGTSVERNARIAGQVLGPDGNGVADALIFASFEPPKPAAPSARLNVGSRSLSDEQGQFVLSGLTPGRYTLVASYPGLASASERGIEAPAADVALHLTQGGVLAGEVSDRANGAPIAAFAVVVTRADGPLTREVVTAESTFDPEGYYEIPALPAGDYQVSARARDYAQPSEQRVTIRAGRETRADFALGRGGTITGTVVDAETSQPLAGARASLESTMGSGAESISLQVAATTDDQGTFTLRGLSPGERTLLCAAAGHHGRIVGRLLVHDGQTTGPITVELTPTGPDEEPRIELAGIGAVLSAEGETLIIGRTIDGGGAAEAGLVTGDAILSVDGATVVDLGFQGSVDRIRGPEGTTVTLVVRRVATGEVQSMVVVRRRIRA